MNNTVVAVFIENRKLLMEKRSKSRGVYAGFLMCPAGHIEEEESFNHALRREIKEELKININRANYLFTIDDIDPFSKLEFKHNFMLIESYKGVINKSQEAEKLVWMSYDELIKTQLVTIVSKLVNRLHEQRLI